MATEVNYGGDGELFVGEDKTLRLHVKDADGVPVNIAGWTILWVAKRVNSGSATVVLSKTGAVSGSYSATVASNTQRVAVTLTDDELATLTAGLYHHSWKRTDAGSETILASGRISPQRATQE